MSHTCPACNQPLPTQGVRACARCHQAIGRHDKWHAVGSIIFHRDCNDTTLTGKKQPVQQNLLEVAP